MKVIEDLQKMIEKKDQSDYTSKGLYPRLQFINKFFLYGGLNHHYDENKMAGGMEELENKLMEKFDCDA